MANPYRQEVYNRSLGLPRTKVCDKGPAESVCVLRVVNPCVLLVVSQCEPQAATLAVLRVESLHNVVQLHHH